MSKMSHLLAQVENEDTMLDDDESTSTSTQDLSDMNLNESNGQLDGNLSSTTIHLTTITNGALIYTHTTNDDLNSDQQQQLQPQPGQAGACPICGDEISGFHYGTFSCESCKGFFKRTVQNKKVFACHSGDGECNITSFNRKRCPACRFAKCMKAGMRIDAIREDRHRGGRSSYEGARFHIPRGTGVKRKFLENIYGGVELLYAFQIPSEPVVPKLIKEIVRIDEVR
jgi:hypothetical protein